MHGSRRRARPTVAISLAVLLAGTVLARAAEQEGPLPRLWVGFHDRLLTVAADDVPLAEILRAVGDATALDVPDDVDASETFTGTFFDLSLPDALDRLLARRTYMLHYGEAGDPEQLVLLPGAVVGAEPAPPATPAAQTTTRTDPQQASPAEEEIWIAQRLTSPDSGTRIVAIRRLRRLPPDRAAAIGLSILHTESDAVVRGQLAVALGKVEEGGGVNVLTQLIDDPEPAVRIAAVRALGRVAVDEAADSLGRTLLYGTDAALRQVALESLASHPQESARNYLRLVGARGGDPMADAARRALSAEVAPPADDSMTASPCLHAAAGPQKGCLEK